MCSNRLQMSQAEIRSRFQGSLNARSFTGFGLRVVSLLSIVSCSRSIWTKMWMRKFQYGTEIEVPRVQEPQSIRQCGALDATYTSTCRDKLCRASGVLPAAQSESATCSWFWLWRCRTRPLWPPLCHASMFHSPLLTPYGFSRLCNLGCQDVSYIFHEKSCQAWDNIFRS